MAATSTPQRLPLSLIALALVVVGASVLLALLPPAAHGPAAPAPAPTAVVKPAAAGPAAAPAAPVMTPRSFTVEIAGGRLKGGDETLKVQQGEQVEIRVSSDQPVVLHLHGYEVEAKVAPPAPALLAFKADLAGRFPVHEHREGAGNHRALLFIEVHP
ncbi:MAG: hypothetical protein QM750_21670 [Rubrivivax sp.]